MASSASDIFRQCCTRNLKLKLLSLMVACCIWGLTSFSRKTHAEIDLPVQLQNVPSGYTQASQLPREIRFTLSGPTLLIEGARRSNSAFKLDLRGIGPGRTLFPHLESSLKLPDGVKVTSISPASLEINLVKTQTRHSEGDQHP